MVISRVRGRDALKDQIETCFGKIEYCLRSLVLDMKKSLQTFLMNGIIKDYDVSFITGDNTGISLPIIDK